MRFTEWDCQRLALEGLKIIDNSNWWHKHFFWDKKKRKETWKQETFSNEIIIRKYSHWKKEDGVEIEIVIFIEGNCLNINFLNK